MAFELVAGRVLAPTIGSSTYVWTSVIGVIIAALSIGYYAGGRLSDRRNRPVDVAWLLLATGLVVIMTTIFYPGVLDSLAQQKMDDRLKGVLASVILFAPASLLLGAISPYLAKLNVDSLSTSGRAIANLSAMNSLGGITGTFVTGFVLFSYVGSRNIMTALGLSLVVISFAIAPKVCTKLRAGTAAIAALMTLFIAPAADALHIDTPSAHYVLTDHHTDRGTIRTIATGPNGQQSGVNLDRSDELVFWYTRQIANVVENTTNKESILILGGGTYTLPKYFANKYPDMKIDVVEIDPKLSQIAQQYFDYKNPGNISEIKEDARTYLNKTNRQYDIVVVDVYGDISVPFSLMTREYGDRVARTVKPGGKVIVNVVAGSRGSCKELLDTTLAPYISHFTDVTV